MHLPYVLREDNLDDSSENSFFQDVDKACNELEDEGISGSKPVEEGESRSKLAQEEGDSGSKPAEDEGESGSEPVEEKGPSRSKLAEEKAMKILCSLPTWIKQTE